MRCRKFFHILAAAAMIFAAVSCGNSGKSAKVPEEDFEAKAMLAGIWVDADADNVVFKIDGDTIYYPDSTSRPVEFKVFGDTMVLLGNNVSKYPILRQSEHVFEFRNQSNEVIRLVKSENPGDSLQFVKSVPIILNQGKTIKSDTIVKHADTQYHCYVQINPTTYKVYRTFYNSDGIEIENTYYDNIIHVSIFVGTKRLFSKDFIKTDFVKAVPENMLSQCVLSDIKLQSLDDAGFHYQTQLAIPDSPTSFIVNLIISYSGQITVNIGR